MLIIERRLWLMVIRDLSSQFVVSPALTIQLMNVKCIFTKRQLSFTSTFLILAAIIMNLAAVLLSLRHGTSASFDSFLSFPVLLLVDNLCFIVRDFSRSSTWPMTAFHRAIPLFSPSRRNSILDRVINNCSKLRFLKLRTHISTSNHYLLPLWANICSQSVIHLLKQTNQVKICLSNCSSTSTSFFEILYHTQFFLS